MKEFIETNKKLITAIIVWLFIHAIIYVYAGSWGRHSKEFYPFTEYDLKSTYNIMEFLVYGIAPCLAAVLIKLNSNNEKA